MATLQYCCSAPAGGLPLRRRTISHRPPPQSSPLRSSPRPPLPNANITFSPPTKPPSDSVVSCDADASLIASLTPKEQTLLLKRQRDWRRALRLFRSLRSQPGYCPNPIHYNVVLRTLGRSRRWDELRLLWVEMAQDAVLPTNNTYAALIDVYGKAGLVKEALLWLRHMRARGVSPDEVTMNTILRILKDSGRFEEGEKFFKSWCNGRTEMDFVEHDFEESDLISPKHFLLTELFKSGGRAPLLGLSSNTEAAPRKPRLAATYNTLIDLYGKAGKLKDASDTFAEMLSSGIEPDTITFNTIINICGSNELFPEADALLAKMEERRITPDTKTFNIFMSMFASVRNIDQVLKYYQKIVQSGLRPDVVSYRIILQALCSEKMLRNVEDVIDEMTVSGASIDEQSIPVVIRMYIEQGMLNEASTFLLKHSSSICISSKNYAAIIDAYAEKGLWKEAEDVFYGKRELVHKKDVEEYNVLIKAYGNAKQYDKAILLFEDMKNCGTWPDQCTYNSMIQMLSIGDMPQRAWELLCRMKVQGLKPRLETFSAVIASYSRQLMIAEAIEMYQEMKEFGLEPNAVVYGSLINMFADAGEVKQALHYLNLMEESGIRANQIVLTSMIKAYSKTSQWQEAQELFAKMKSLADGPDTIASNCMINLYANLGMITEAKLTFDNLRLNGQADGVSYATMMYLYRSMGMLDEACDIGQEMQNSGLLNNCAMFNNVIASYSANNKLRECAELLHQMQAQMTTLDASTFKIIFALLKKGGMPFEAVTQVEMLYSKGEPNARQATLASLFSMVGLHDLALEHCDSFLTSGTSLDLAAYNVAICTYGASGNVNKALNLYMRMQDEGMKPDLVTYIGLVDCYGKARMIEGLRRIYGLLKCGEIETNESLYKALIVAYRHAGRPDLADLVDQDMRFSIQMLEDDDVKVEED